MSHKPVLGKISDEATAKDFAYTLLPSERQLLYDELKKTMEEKENTQDATPPSTAQLVTAFQCGFWPFIGFGFFDNCIMILAGDLIEYEFGQILHISTMAAAALGNLVSDVCGMWDENCFIVTTLEIRDATRLNGVTARRNLLTGVESNS
uniref:Transmembrane protein 65 n=1 Tax=Magallana gigas TaxID=29159 RepID=K1Q8A9_MAGGI